MLLKIQYIVCSLFFRALKNVLCHIRVGKKFSINITQKNPLHFSEHRRFSLPDAGDCP